MHQLFFIMKKPVRYTLTALILLASLGFFTNLSLILFPSLYEGTFYTNIEDAPAVPYLIVLGGGITDDGILVPPVQERISLACSYLSVHEDTTCIVTGGTLKKKKYAEAPAMKKALCDQGIAPERILVEDTALDTIQNLSNSIRLISDSADIPLDEAVSSPVLIVTNRFHTGRSLYLSKRMGIVAAAGISAPTPAAYVLFDYLREIAAWAKLELRILCTGKPEPLVLLTQ